MLGQAHRPLPRVRRAAGFTVVEVLVAGAVIAVLMSILLPSLQTARAQVQRTVCGARLAQWGVAFSCYAAENDASWPHCDGLDRGPRELGHPLITREDVADWFGWVDVLPQMLGQEPWRVHARFERPKGNTFFQCPAARPDAERALYSYNPLRDGWFSYAMNSCLELDANAWSPPEYAANTMPSFLDTARIVAPARVLLLFDQLLDPRRGFDGQAPNPSAGRYCGSYPKAFAARHRRRADRLGGNILFCDGHVEWRTSVWKQTWEPDREVPPRDDPDWYPYPDPLGQR